MGEGCTYKWKSGKSCTAEAFKPCLFKTKTAHFSALFKRGVTIFSDLFCFAYRIEQIFQTNIVEIDI